MLPRYRALGGCCYGRVAGRIPGQRRHSLAAHDADKEVVACAFGPVADAPRGAVRILKLERLVTFSGNPWAALADRFAAVRWGTPP